MSKSKRNKELLNKQFISKEGNQTLEERLKKEVEKKKAAHLEQLENKINSLNFKVSQ